MDEVRIDAGTIRYADQGSGQPIVFLHGALANHRTWRKVLRLIPPSFRCIAPDMPFGGHALPLGAGADLSPPGVAAMLGQFLDALGAEDIILVGNDTGGAYAQVFAAAQPQRIAKLVLCNVDCLDVFPPKHFASLQTGLKLPGYAFLMAQLFRYRPFLTTRMAMGLLSHALTRDEIAELYVSSFVSDRRIRADFKRFAAGWSSSHTQAAAASLAGFDRPVSIIWGADDRILFPVDLGRRLSAVFPNATFQLIEGAATYVQEDQPEAFVRALELSAEVAYASDPAR
ncbi:MAG TPA: alpha/beta fold hydrolase [Herpetosiphonaceae bacterium]